LAIETISGHTCRGIPGEFFNDFLRTPACAYAQGSVNPDAMFVYYERNGVYRGRDEIERIAGAIRASHPDYRFFQPLNPPEEMGMAGGTDGRRAALGMGHLTPGLISSSPGKAGLPPFIAFTLDDSVALYGAYRR
jgi:hypothetical protein